jgi:hypothetical protein
VINLGRILGGAAETIAEIESPTGYQVPKELKLNPNTTQYLPIVTMFALDEVDLGCRPNPAIAIVEYTVLCFSGETFRVPRYVRETFFL